MTISWAIGAKKGGDRTLLVLKIKRDRFFHTSSGSIPNALSCCTFLKKFREEILQLIIINRHFVGT
ncbi:hypothetical protein H6F77_06105 [Microcoleus sp. FACHB-831]|uniref:hypothetical protein n=1 Tax=Microcoleus sp. FACHB-831 TaxID=2692827 RepID=UPI00168596CF|nr:hypothetical protein [Microcoleus sp. FACHB-831]MBD1920661.1 hypothetical protein [Microcoleus sp. FACHB-831]